ncbi:MAG TPA: aspartate carbamoyltransferase catalytic subunit [Dehalococcoidia bacterium]|nr:aspartate carbamoyltransferase catalytic subunit [Dehalococcoidia bacterium]
MVKQQEAPRTLVDETQPPPASNWQRRHVLDVDDFSVEEFELVMTTADAMKEVLGRDVPRTPALRGTTIVNLFYENSTRTRTSFELAAKALGADVVNIAASASSVTKGESLIDTVRTVQALGAQIVVMRHSSSGAPYLASRHSRLSFINAGDGWHAHPTQALLDLYTLRETLGSVRGLKVVICGDITHSRVARSNMWSLTAMGANVTVSGPPTLIPRELAHPGEGRLPPVRVDYDFERAIAGAEVVMMLRLQAERQQAGLLPSLREYAQLYQLTDERLAMAAPGAVVMHPGPMNEGVEIAPSVAHGARSLIESQVQNGVAVRMALLYLLAGQQRNEP